MIEYREMIYKITDNTIPEILVSGFYEGRQFYILNIGGHHPCAYVQADYNYYNIVARDLINCHRGLTFSGTLRGILDDRNYIGWDYAHDCDYFSGAELLYSADVIDHLKKWTTIEILEEIKLVIKQLNKMELK